MERIKQLAIAAKQESARVVVGGAALLAGGVANAQTSGSHASDFQAIFTGAATDFGTLIGYAITLAVAVWGGLVVFKLAKKLYNKAT